MTNPITDMLKNLALLTPLPDEVLDRLPERMVERMFEKDDVLFKKADPGGSMFLIVEGLVAIVLHHADGSDEVLNTLGPGDALGQMSLLEPSPRTAGAIAASPTRLLELTSEDFQEVLQGQPESIVQAILDVSHQMRLGYLDILKETNIFKGLSEDIITSLARKLVVEHLKQDQTLFAKGDPGDALYIIDEGGVKIVTTDAAGSELVLNKLGAGESIGEMSLIDQEPRSASVIATMPTTMLRLSRSDFMEAIQDQPTIALEVMKDISGRLRFATIYIERAIEWSKRVAEGDYNIALDQISNSQSNIGRGSQAANEARATELLAAYAEMVSEVQKREEDLKQQVLKLTIEIDEAKRKQEVQNLTGSEFFSDLKAKAQQLREQRDEDE